MDHFQHSEVRLQPQQAILKFYLCESVISNKVGGLICLVKLSFCIYCLWLYRQEFQIVKVNLGFEKIVR